MNRTDRRILRWGMVALLAAALAGPTLVQPDQVDATGTRFYVSNAGRDSNPGTYERPWRTLQKAANSAPAGSIIYVRGGVYAGFVMRRSGKASAPTTFLPRGNEKVVVAGGASTVDVIRISGAHDVVIKNFVVRGASASKSGSGIRIDGGSYRITVAGSVLLENRSYGISIIDSTQVRVSYNDIRGNAEGVYIRGRGSGTRIMDNRIHHQDRMVVATAGGSDDHGGVGVSLVKTTGAVLVAENRIWANRAASPDWGHDGAAIEIYGADYARIERNRIWDNQVVMETGSDGEACKNNKFIRNVVWSGRSTAVSKGIMFRCAEGMIVANNTFYRLDEWVFDLKQGGSAHATSIGGLRLVNNIAVMASGKIFGVESALPSSVLVDYNLIWHEATNGNLGSVVGHGWTSSMATLRAWTGFNVHGVNRPPRFVDPAALNFHLRSTSPAIDRGMVLSVATAGYRGSAPDIGSFETH